MCQLYECSAFKMIFFALKGAQGLCPSFIAEYDVILCHERGKNASYRINTFYISMTRQFNKIY